MPKVFSSHIDEIDYADGTLTVRWQTGRVSNYSGVPAEVAKQVMGAASIGSALRNLVRGRYDHAYLPEEDEA